MRGGEIDERVVAADRSIKTEGSRQMDLDRGSQTDRQMQTKIQTDRQIQIVRSIQTDGINMDLDRWSQTDRARQTDRKKNTKQVEKKEATTNRTQSLRITQDTMKAESVWVGE